MPPQAVLQFPQGFLWGCATASHQVEGQNRNSWTQWEDTPGHIFNNQKSGRACDWWSGRYKEDFDRAANMNNNTQRISVEWSRIEPEPGKWDDSALEVYRDMLKALRDCGMTPMVTLHHFTEPLWVAEHDGWLWDELPTYFERFARKVVGTLGDLCSLWCTINEPMVYATQGYSFGRWPPGIKNPNALNEVTINMLKGHAAAYHAIKELQPNSSVGLAMHIVDMQPCTPVFLNWLAYYLVDRFFNRTFAMALKDGIVRLPLRRNINLPQAKDTLDWIGIQYYQHFLIRFNLMSPATLFIVQSKPTDMPCGPEGWGGLKPEAIYDHIKWFSEMLKKPVYVTETGVPDPDDTQRPGYLIRTVRSVWHAINMGYDVKGFYFWSLLDNFEWAEGFDPRFSFGLHKMNFETQERTARPSANLYGEICRRNGLTLEMVERYAPEVMSKVFPGDTGLNDVQLKVRAQA